MWYDPVMKLFYVYEHWRNDLDVCFYVGKGKKGRAYDRNNRNKHWHHIVNKLERSGSSYEIRIVIDGVSEKDAFNVEMSRISFWRSHNIELSNKTDGGEGFVGGKHSDKTKKLISCKKKGVPNPKMSALMKGRAPHNKGKPGLSGADHPMFGYVYSPEQLAEMRQRSTGRVASEETKKRISASLKGRSAPNKGKPRSESSRAKQSATIRANGGVNSWNLGKTGYSKPQKNSINITDMVTGKTYSSVSEAARALQTTRDIVSSQINGASPKRTYPFNLVRTSRLEKVDA
jgi:hypothetical protein